MTTARQPSSSRAAYPRWCRCWTVPARGPEKLRPVSSPSTVILPSTNHTHTPPPPHRDLSLNNHLHYSSRHCSKMIVRCVWPFVTEAASASRCRAWRVDPASLWCAPARCAEQPGAVPALQSAHCGGGRGCAPGPDAGQRRGAAGGDSPLTFSPALASVAATLIARGGLGVSEY